MKVQTIDSFFKKSSKSSKNEASSSKIVEVPKNVKKKPSKSSKDSASAATESDEEDPLPKSSRSRKKKDTEPEDAQTESSKKSRSKKLKVEEDDEDPMPSSKSKKELKKRKAKVLSDSESEDFEQKNSKGKNIKGISPEKKKKKQETEKLDPVSAVDFFGGKVKKPERGSDEKKKEKENISSRTIKEKSHGESRKKLKDEAKEEPTEVSKKSSKQTKTLNKSEKHKKINSESSSDEDFTPKKSSKKGRGPVAEKTPVKQETNVPKTPEEKRSQQKSNYMKFLAHQNAKPKNLGSKEIPEGPPDCLAGKTFVITGVLDSLERGDADDLIKKHGGRLTSAVSGKTSYLIVGDDPGASKVSKAKSLSIPQINEDDLLDMIRSSKQDKKSDGKSKKQKVVADSDSSDDDGFDIKALKAKKRQSTSKTPSKAPSQAKPKSSTSSTPVTPEEKKSAQRSNYMKFLAHQNAKPKNLGSKEIPEGAPNCLEGMTFVITGVLDSLERGDADDLIKKYGGRITSAVSGKTTYLITGDDCGATKLNKAKSLGIPQIDENGLLDIIRASKPQKKIKVEPMNLEEQTSVEKKKKTRHSSTPTKAKHEVKIEVKEAVLSPDHSKVLPLQPPKLVDDLMWVDKYKPKDIKDIVGQGGDSSNARKLLRWLENWFSLYHAGAKEKVAYGPWAKDPEGKSFRAALLSGGPGIGKTTTAHLVCKKLGYDYFELNASDTRNKKGLHSTLADALTSKTIVRGSNNRDELTDHHVLIMDEVDGMSGNEDRGGIQELISLLKISHVPVICICNDRNHVKIRSLANYCFDLRFYKPRFEQLKAYILKICFRENFTMTPEQIQKLIISSDHDVRQILHQLEVFKGSKALNILNPKKDLRFGPWDVCRKVFSKQEREGKSINELASLYFQDYSIGPLFVQENYIRWTPADAKGNKLEILKRANIAAESIANGDLVDAVIRGSNNWSLLPTAAVFASVIPGNAMAGSNGGVEFPAWLGKNSNRGKRSRLLQQLHTHVHLNISGSLEALNLDYLPYLRRAIVKPLSKGKVEVAAQKMEDYNLIREDLDNINELAMWPGMSNPLDKLDSKTKAAFTRQVNKEMLPYSVVKVTKGKGKQPSNEELMAGADADADEADVSEEELSVEKDAMVKVKKSKATAGKAGTSKKGTSKRSKKAVVDSDSDEDMKPSGKKKGKVAAKSRKK